MSVLISNLAIQGAIAAVLVAVAAFITAGANWLNTRTRIMEQGLQIAELQRLTAQLSITQQVQAHGPTIVNVPAPAAPITGVPTSDG